MAATAASPSLTDTFKKANHWRHHIMDASMLLLAIGAAVTAAGPMVGIFDPITPFLKMHFEGFLMAPDILSDFIPDAFDNLGDGVLASGMDIGSAHDMGGMAHGAMDMASGMDMDAGFDDWLRNLGASGDLQDVLQQTEGQNLYDFWSQEYGHNH